MKGAIETFVSFIIIIFIVTICSFYIYSNLIIADARNYHASIIEQIESSNGSAKVIKDCKDDAADSRYTLKIEPAEMYENKNYYYVTIEYKYEIPVIGTISSGVIEGYAR